MDSNGHKHPSNNRSYHDKNRTERIRIKRIIDMCILRKYIENTKTIADLVLNISAYLVGLSTYTVIKYSTVEGHVVDWQAIRLHIPHTQG